MFVSICRHDVLSDKQPLMAALHHDVFTHNYRRFERYFNPNFYMEIILSENRTWFE